MQLAHPTLNDNVDEDLELVNYRLGDIAQVREEVEELTDLLEDKLPPPVKTVKSPSNKNPFEPKKPEVGTEVIEEGFVTGAPDSAEVDMPDNVVAAVVDIDVENENDGEKAQSDARHIKIDFEPNDVRFWFSQLEAEMMMAEVKSQWLKKTVLQRNLPNKQKEDVKAYLTLSKTQAGDDIYFKIKSDLIRIYAPKPQDSYRKALTRTMVGLPSQLGLQIVDDVCKRPSRLEGCCCAGAVEALWSDKLPVGIRAHISNREFSHATYKEVFEAADKVYLSSKQVSVAAMTVASVSLDETQAAFNPENQPQVAAFGANKNQGNKNNKGKNKKNKNQTGGQGGGQSQAKPRGPRHSSSPPEACCDRHYRHGASAWYCVAPLTCPWVNKCAPRA